MKKTVIILTAIFMFFATFQTNFVPIQVNNIANTHCDSIPEDDQARKCYEFYYSLIESRD